MTYRYDGTFAGFLCCVADAVERGIAHPAFWAEGATEEAVLFAGEEMVWETDPGAAQAFRGRFVAAVSRDCFATARYAFHSDAPGIEALLWRYLRLGLEAGSRLAGMLATEPVHSVGRIARRVAHEAHKFKGFVRFREMEAGFLYAAIEPQADILELIAPHFADRIGDTPWMIHDLGRSRAAVCDRGRWRLLRGIDQAAAPDCSAAEALWCERWQRYFNNMAIAERRNPRLQRQHVPLRVRQHLTEFGTPATS